MDVGMYHASRLTRTAPAATVNVKSGILKIIDIAALASLTLNGRVINVRFFTTFS